MKITVLLTLALLPIGTVYCQQPIQENAVTSQSYDHRIPSDRQEVRASPAAKNIILLIGDGPLKASLPQIADDLDLKDRLRIINTVSSLEITSYINCMDLLVLPSRQHR